MSLRQDFKQTRSSRAPGHGASEKPCDRQSAALKKRYLLRRFWTSAAGYWGSRGEQSSWFLAGILLLISLLNLATAYGMNVWHRGMFDALEQRDSDVVLMLSIAYFGLLAASVVFSVSLVYARMTAQRRWRAWLNKHLTDRWLAKGRYYQLNLVEGDHKNPEYRIADDIRVATESPVDFATGMTAALLSAATFIAVLWTIGGALTVQLGGLVITIPGFLVIAAVVYAIAASGSMTVIGKRFIAVAENKNQAEAEYRYALTRLRENGESIALLHGEEEERNALDGSFRNVLRGWRNVCIQNMRTTIVSQTSSYIAPVLPIILCAPKFLEGSMSLGQVMQAASAFTIVQAAFNWLVDNYPRLAEWGASARRVASLEMSLDALDRAETGFGLIDRGQGETAALRLRNLSVTLDDGTAVVKDAEVAIASGEKVLITGESGVGKSTLVRAIAGLWPWGEGDIRIRSGAKLFLLPQRPYIPIGTLRRAATYPDPADSRSSREIVAALEKVGLGYVAERLDEDGPWDQILSGGEKQRLGFARILLQGPDIIVLDEATAALDPASQDRLLRLLSELERTTVLSVGHAPELEAFHSRKVVLERRPGGAKLVSDPVFVAKSGRVRRWMRRQGVPRAA
jgi:vitamin B12/bleomycin/antimicrobial peptide transport system ATP-binding/permease protein